MQIKGLKKKRYADTKEMKITFYNVGKEDVNFFTTKRYFSM